MDKVGTEFGLQIRTTYNLKTLSLLREGFRVKGYNYAMKENPEFIGPSANHEREEKADALRRWSAEASNPLEGEGEKSEIEVKIIKIINSMFADELKSLGIEEYDPIPQEKVHILPDPVFKAYVQDGESKASFSSTKDTVYLNRERTDTRARMVSTLLHELIHRTSTTKFYGAEDGGIHDARTGYRIRSPWKGPERQDRLRGFNELMVDYTVYKILLRNRRILGEELEITEEEINGAIYSYMHYEPILNAIIKKVSEDKDISPGEVFNAFEKCQFASNILVLKDLERSFGKGSLEVLSLLETLEEHEGNDKLELMIRAFFAEHDAQRRQQLRSEIVSFAHQSATRKDVIE